MTSRSTRQRRPQVVPAAVALMALLGMVVAGVAVRADRAEAAWPAGKPRSFVVHHDGSPLDIVTEAPRRALFTFNAWEWDQAAQVKATNPDALVVVYKDMSSVRSYPGAYDNGRDADLLPTGVGYAYADAHHPEWFLTDSSGTRLEWGPWPDHWFMDVGNPAYQERWYQNVSAELEANGWDGVFIDNALTGSRNYGAPPAKYPSNAAMQAAVRSMLANVSPRLQQDGFLTFANINESRLYPGLWEDWIQLLDGAMEEWFVNWTSEVGALYTWDWGSDGWRAMIEQVAAAERHGKTAIVRSGGNPADPEAARYGLGSYLLAANGNAMFSFRDRTWFPELEYDLGEATSGMQSWGASVFARHFEKGLVVVNAGREPAAVGLPGAYLDASDAVVDDVALGATRAAILRAAAPAPTTTAVPTTTTSAPPTTTTSAPPTTTTTVAPATTTAAPPTTTTAPTTTTTRAPAVIAPPTTVVPTTTTPPTAPTATTAAPTTTVASWLSPSYRTWRWWNPWRLSSLPWGWSRNSRF